MYTQLEEFAQQFVASRPTTAMDGEYYELPGVIMYHTATLRFPDKGRIEINKLTTAAPETFEWQYEITIDDKPSGSYIHLLLRRDGTLVETYGKTVLQVDNKRAVELYELLQRLSESTS